ncbi:MAG: GMP/IMP nucleotidase [bacterium]
MRNIKQPDWQIPHTVFLDMDGTLLDLHFDNHFWLDYLPQCLAERDQRPVTEVRQQLHERYHTMKGTLDWYCLDYWSTALKVDIVALKREISDLIAIREQANVEPFLQFLHDRQQRVVLLTNAHRGSVDLKFQSVELAGYFHRVISSHDLGIPKEQAGFWQALAQTEPFDQAHSVFIDDNIDVLNNAQHYGIAHLFAIHQPDSQKAPKDTTPFISVECFSQLMSKVC